MDLKYNEKKRKFGLKYKSLKTAESYQEYKKLTNWSKSKTRLLGQINKRTTNDFLRTIKAYMALH